MADNNGALVARVWNYAHVLRRQGVPFGDYIEQITYLLFLKMDEEREDLTGELSVISWTCTAGIAQGAEWRRAGDALSPWPGGVGQGTRLLGQIFKGAQNKISDPANCSDW